MERTLCAAIALALHACCPVEAVRDAEFKAVRDAEAEAVRDALRHLWKGYKENGWGQDEVSPFAGPSSARWGGIGMFILDTMDTLWLAGMHEEFQEAEQWVEKLRFDGPSLGYRTSFFEVTIRGLGGLLSAHALSGHEVFLQKAKELGGRLVQAFPSQDSDREGQWPHSYLDLRNPSDYEVVPSFAGGTESLADAGSNLLEFSYLSDASKDLRFRKKAEDNENKLLSLSSPQHLLPKFLAAYERKSYGTEKSVGSNADSYYEYLLKAYLQSGQKDTQLLKEWKQAMSEMRRDLLRTSTDGFSYIADGIGSSSMEHLSCFIPGLLALGEHRVPKREVEAWWLPTAEALVHTCYEMYRRQPSGLAPDVVEVEPSMRAVDPQYKLRPETLESLFYVHRVTGNETYRKWSFEIFKAIDQHTRAPYGFAGVRDVREVPVRLLNSEETFMGAETLKYALLIHLPKDKLPLDRFVLNTEAHPLRIEASDVKFKPPDEVH